MYNGAYSYSCLHRSKNGVTPTPNVTTGSFWGNNDVTGYSDQSEQFCKARALGLL